MNLINMDNEFNDLKNYKIQIEIILRTIKDKIDCLKSIYKEYHDKPNIFNEDKYAPKVERYKNFLGEDVTEIVPKTNFSDPNLENPPAEDPQATEVTYDENIFGGSGI